MIKYNFRTSRPDSNGSQEGVFFIFEKKHPKNTQKKHPKKTPRKNKKTPIKKNTQKTPLKKHQFLKMMKKTPKIKHPNLHYKINTRKKTPKKNTNF